ncbi:tRNA (adenosine(37)-N6)-threonylcarbamoyltransferase complex dimerization subunit type 1 TsaB [Stakelama pacifica]|uniref:tRNA threonylcarbamoyl adenosine modification protein YeaZ n=1 Tax=Stakelama pacifica TaxID=517720 RepID=A0A4V6PR62_9SPHN|nr:tRNA (adenosine(37)-N6)-threonylcarbamoyltransferase complex dimerization subunit type 1 TsaB [Stakelama pacifica]TDN79328.1 tRNA threonylcarbamoyl adenosine modification protein YeaZ [Stakelama pacifica]GGO98387.1 tRNA (adenosine(37)-N6)-threonylcarbamoyltransferase complex dimerization subunit type 1 TsaB [Stakelama pacifica]
MRTLVIETATAACSIALFDGDTIIANEHQVVGRGHAERLIPMIGAFPEQGRAERILVDCGPGSFTGVRVGLAAARGLGIGWGATVSGFSSTALIAAAHFANPAAADALMVVLEGGHGEVFVQGFEAHPLRPVTALASMKPDAALGLLGGRQAVGNGVLHLLAIDPALAAAEALPDAACTLTLPESLRSLPAVPIYGRAPDAKPVAP